MKGDMGGEHVGDPAPETLVTVTLRNREDAMSVDVSTEVTIQCPVDRVSQYASDPDNAPRWYVNIKSVEWETAKPLRVGARISFVAQFLGKRLAYTYEVVELIPGRQLRMRTAQGPFPMETTYLWEAMGPAMTRMTLRNRGTPSGFSVLMAPFMAMAMRRANRKDLSMLKSILEGSAH